MPGGDREYKSFKRTNSKSFIVKYRDQNLFKTLIGWFSLWLLLPSSCLVTNYQMLIYMISKSPDLFCGAAISLAVEQDDLLRLQSQI